MTKNAYYAIRRAIWKYPSIFLPIIRVRRHVNNKLPSDSGLCLKLHPEGRLPVDRDTAIVIEGFPRSANTFAEVAFRMAQPNALKIAHHLHAPAQILRGVALRIPVVVLIRDPREALASAKARIPNADVQDLIRDYISFYGSILSEKENFVLANFKDVTSNFGAVVERVNCKFGTHFVPFRNSPYSVALVFGEIEKRSQALLGETSVDEAKVARPSRERAVMKRGMWEIIDNPSCQFLLRQATELYEDYTH